jgi:nucleotide-binding universal stress UspA family protein
LDHALTTYGDDEIVVLHVIAPHAVEDPLTGSEDWYDDAREDAESILADARAAADEHGVDVTTELEVGEPWRAIVEYADAHDVDHVIMGSHGRDDDSKLPLGSVAETVMRRSPVLVSVVR